MSRREGERRKEGRAGEVVSCKVLHEVLCWIMTRVKSYPSAREERQVDPWDSVARQPHQMSELQGQ